MLLLMAKLVAQSGPTAGREFPLVNDLTGMGPDWATNLAMRCSIHVEKGLGKDEPSLQTANGKP